MAEISLTCSPVIIINNSGGGGAGEVNVTNRALVRTAGPFAANTSLDINLPGPGWVASGDSIVISSASDFVSNTQFFRNGQLLLTGENSSTNNDVYFVSTTAVAFEHPIQTNDILQIWKFTTASGA